MQWTHHVACSGQHVTHGEHAVSLRDYSIVEPVDGLRSFLGKETGHNKNKMNEIS